MRVNYLDIERVAKMERAQLVGDLIAGGVIWIGRTWKRFAFWLQPIPPLSPYSTAAEVIEYANSIRKTQPAFADELITFATRDK